MKKIDLRLFIKPTILFALFVLTNNAYFDYPFSTAILVAALFSKGGSPILLPLYILAFVFAPEQLLGGAIAAVPVLTIYILYKKAAKREAKRELCLFTLLAQIPFVLLYTDITLVENCLLAAISSIFTLLIQPLFSGEGDGKEHALSLAALFVFAGTGALTLFGFAAYKAIAVLAMLIIAVTRKKNAYSYALALAAPAFIVSYDLGSFGAILALGAIAVTTVGVNRYLAATVTVLMDALLGFLGVYLSYSALELIFTAVAALAFSAIPFSLLGANNKYDGAHITKTSINRSRKITADALYEVAAVYSDIAACFMTLETSLDTEKVKNELADKKFEELCYACNNFDRCKRCYGNMREDMNKLFLIGFAKGRISLVDIPKSLAENCLFVNNIIFSVNKTLSAYKTFLLEAKAGACDRELMCSLSRGTASVFKRFALELSTSVKFDGNVERKLYAYLRSSGLNVLEVLSADGKCSFTTADYTNEEKLTRKLSAFYKSPYAVTDSFKIDNCFYYTAAPAPKYDIVFGLSGAAKTGSEVSGDTRCVIRLPNNRVLIAISDGMGSGKEARGISDTTITLVENLFKAGYDAALAVKTINKILASTERESFAAVDITLLDLMSGKAEFIKIGAAYGFILGESGTRIVEGEALPIGILSATEPSVATTDIIGGDVLVMMSDGVAEAFGSSSDLIDFLSGLPKLNPQSISSSVVNKAKENSVDDMTVLAVRVFEKDKVA